MACQGQRVATPAGSDVQPAFPGSGEGQDDVQDRLVGACRVLGEALRDGAVEVGRVGDLATALDLLPVGTHARGPGRQGRLSGGSQRICSSGSHRLPRPSIVRIMASRAFRAQSQTHGRRTSQYVDEHAAHRGREAGADGPGEVALVPEEQHVALHERARVVRADLTVQTPMLGARRSGRFAQARPPRAACQPALAGRHRLTCRTGRAAGTSRGSSWFLGASPRSRTRDRPGRTASIRAMPLPHARADSPSGISLPAASTRRYASLCAMTMRSGGWARSHSTAFRRHWRQELPPSMPYWPMLRVPRVGSQPPRRRVMSRQPSLAALRFTAGSHISACESPRSRTWVVPSRGPKRQRRACVPGFSTMHLSLSSGWSYLACASLGLRATGTRR